MVQDIFAAVANNFHDHAKSDGPKNRKFRAVLQAIVENLASSSQRVSGELIICAVWFITFTTLGKYPELLNCLSRD